MSNVDKDYKDKLLALARLHSHGGRAVAVSVGCTPASFNHIRAGKRSLPDRFVEKMSETLGFDETGFIGPLRIRALLCRSVQEFTQLMEAGFEVRWMYRLHSSAEESALQKYVLFEARFGSTRRIFLLRMLTERYEEMALNVNFEDLPIIKTGVQGNRMLNHINFEVSESIFPAWVSTSTMKALEDLHTKEINDWVDLLKVPATEHPSSLIKMDAHGSVYIDALIRSFGLTKTERATRFMGRVGERDDVFVQIKVLSSARDYPCPVQNDSTAAHIIVAGVIGDGIIEILYEGPLRRLIEYANEEISWIKRKDASQNIETVETAMHKYLDQLDLRDLNMKVYPDERLRRITRRKPV